MEAAVCGLLAMKLSFINIFYCFSRLEAECCHVVNSIRGRHVKDSL